MGGDTAGERDQAEREMKSSLLRGRPDSFHSAAIPQTLGILFELVQSPRGELRPVDAAELELPFQLEGHELAALERGGGFGGVE